MGAQPPRAKAAGASLPRQAQAEGCSLRSGSGPGHGFNLAASTLCRNFPSCSDTNGTTELPSSPPSPALPPHPPAWHTAVTRPLPQGRGRAGRDSRAGVTLSTAVPCCARGEEEEGAARASPEPPDPVLQSESWSRSPPPLHSRAAGTRAREEPGRTDRLPPLQAQDLSLCHPLHAAFLQPPWDPGAEHQATAATCPRAQDPAQVSPGLGLACGPRSLL